MAEARDAAAGVMPQRRPQPAYPQHEYHQQHPQRLDHQLRNQQQQSQLQQMMYEQQQQSLQEMIDSVFTEEPMEGENRVYCEVCKCNMSSRKRMCAISQPDILILSLKRFLDLNTKIMKSVNLSRHVRYDGKMYRLRSVIVRSLSLSLSHIHAQHILKRNTGAYWNLHTIRTLCDIHVRRKRSCR